MSDWENFFIAEVGASAALTGLIFVAVSINLTKMQNHIASIRAALAPEGTLQQRLERLFRAFAQLAEQENHSINVYMSALCGVKRAFQEEATRLLRDYIAVITLMLEESRARLRRSSRQSTFFGAPIPPSYHALLPSVEVSNSHQIFK